MSFYFEDFELGKKFITPAKSISQGGVDVAAGLCGLTNPLFNDQVYAQKTRFGGRIVPGRFVLLLMGGLEEQLGLYDETAIALVGIDKVRFHAPVKAGDTLRVEVTIAELKETSKPDRGIVAHHSRCLNQRDEMVLESQVTHLIKRRPATPEKGEE